MEEISKGQLSISSLLRVMEVTRKLAAPFELAQVLEQVIDAGREVLQADRGSVFLYDPATQELFSTVATGSSPIRLGISQGIAGECATTRTIVNVPDCYADPRFSREVDRKTGYRTRCLLTVPLIGLDQELVGVMQLLNAEKGLFDEADEHVAQILASQAAVAIQRTRLLEERLVKIKLESDLELARQIQMGVLPRQLPACAGYELATYIRPAEQTGGDLYDVVRVPGDNDADASLVFLLADATGHGVGPALNVTQVRAMMRMGLRLGADLDSLLNHLFAQLADDLTSCRMVTAFIGRLDPGMHEIQYHAAGQGPVLHYHYGQRHCEWINASTVPLGIMDAPEPVRPVPMTMEPGDIVALLTDGVYEYHNRQGQQLGTEPVGRVVDENRDQPAQQVLDRLLQLLDEFGCGAAQSDDVTGILVRRLP